ASRPQRPEKAGLGGQRHRPLAPDNRELDALEMASNQRRSTAIEQIRHGKPSYFSTLHYQIGPFRARLQYQLQAIVRGMIVENPPLFAIEKSAHLLRVGNDPGAGPTQRDRV